MAHSAVARCSATKGGTERVENSNLKEEGRESLSTPQQCRPSARLTQPLPAYAIRHPPAATESPPTHLGARDIFILHPETPG